MGTGLHLIDTYPEARDTPTALFTDWCGYWAGRDGELPTEAESDKASLDKDATATANRGLVRKLSLLWHSIQIECLFDAILDFFGHRSRWRRLSSASLAAELRNRAVFTGLACCSHLSPLIRPPLVELNQDLVAWTEYTNTTTQRWRRDLMEGLTSLVL